MKKFLVISAVILLAAVIINYALGGFREIEPGLVSTKAITLYGFQYEGRYNSNELDNKITQLRTLLDASEQDGTLTIINYMQPEFEKRGVVKQFVGIIWEKDTTSSLVNLTTLQLEPCNAIQFEVPVKPLVMPSPEKLRKLAEEMAEQMESQLAGWSMEQYRGQKLIINYPIK